VNWLAIITVPVLLIGSALAIQQSVYASESSPYDSGYDHGCDDADISDPDDRYINQPGKGPSFHTDEFMRGYNSGYNSCSSGGSSSDGEAQSSSSSWSLDVDLRQSTFGVPQAEVILRGPFGYEDRQSVRTGPDASVSFDVPSDAVPEGYRYQVCVSGGLVSSILPNCRYFNHGSGNEAIWMAVPG
jgi:hypothetical protein